MNSTKQIQKVMNRFPEGSNNYNFLKELCKKFEPDCLRKSVQKELNEGHADLSGSTQQYFKYHIIYTSALKTIDCSQLQRDESARDNVELFHLNILKKYVHNDDSCEKLKLFEGSQAFLANMLQIKQKSKSVKQFTKLVEDNINEFCIQFTEYVLQRKVPVHNWEIHFDSAVKQLSPRVAILDSADARFSAVTQELQAVLLTYYKELCEGIEILNNLFELFERKLDGQELRSEWITNRSEHLLLKLECFKFEVQASTYTKNAIKALRIIKSELEDKKEVTEKKIRESRDKLENYQILGPEYEQLVEKYQMLTESIKKQKWAIEYLKAENAPKDN